MTAVQWYAIESGKLEVERAKGYLSFLQMFNKMLEILNEAKAMEKEQIQSAYIKGYTESSWGRHSNSENYYNKTFKS